MEPYSNAKDNEMLREIEKIYLVNPTYGYRRIKAELNRSGYAIGKKKVAQKKGQALINPQKKGQALINSPFILKRISFLIVF